MTSTVTTDQQTGVLPAQTLVRIRNEDASLVVTQRDVYNERSRATMVALAGRSRMEYLLSVLEDGQYFVEHQVDANGRLTHLFFADDRAIDIYRQNPDVVMMDCTYRTNRFGMPLLNIVGVTGMNTIIHIGQVFLRGETQADFMWALTQLKKLAYIHSIESPQVIFTDRDLALLNALELAFPYTPVLLCIWHIVKDVETHARVHTFRREMDPERSRPRSPVWRDSAEHRAFCDAFLRVVRSTSEEEYELRRRVLHAMSPVEATYIDDVWLDIWKYRIVRVWTNRVVHFGMQATSRVEGYHAKLKTWIGSSKADLLTIHARLQHWWGLSIAKHENEVAESEVKLRQRLRAPLYAAVVKVIHNSALLRCVELLDRSELLQKPCSGVYSHTNGLPCVHRLHAAAFAGQALQPSEFHAHWRIRREFVPHPERPLVIEPLSIQARRLLRAEIRRNMRGGGPQGTRRGPSAFEASLQPAPSARR